MKGGEKQRWRERRTKGRREESRRTMQFPNSKFAILTDENAVISGSPLNSFAASQMTICAGESRRNR